MDDVSSLRSSATAFAEQHAMTVVPAVPLHDLAPEVQLYAEVIDLPGFLALAQRMRAPALQLKVDPFDPELDLVADPAYQHAGSAAARKQAAERFLTTWGDGWAPPTVAREELYARAQRLAKTAARPPALY